MKAPDSPSYSRSRLYHTAVTCGAAIAGLTVVAFFLAWSWLGTESGDPPPVDSYLAICAVAKVRLCQLLCWPLPKAPTQSQTGGFEDTRLRTSLVAPLAPRSALSLAVQTPAAVSLFAALCALSQICLSLPLQDQPADIRAWVDYHYALGIPRVYLFDNNSTPPLSSALQDHIDDGIVQCELAPHQFSGLHQHVLQDAKLQAMLLCG